MPGEPVSNKEMENFIGRINGEKSRFGPLILRQNKIKERYYAIDANGQSEWTCASLIAQAVKQALQNSELTARDITFLAAATSQYDYLVPGLASMVHAETDFQPLEVASFQSVCASSMMAMKDAWLQIKAGEHQNAVVGAGEFASRFFQPGFYESTKIFGEDGKVPLSAEFLRWTLSDGAAAVVLENRPNKNGFSLEIEWIKLKSFANRFLPCMYAGGKQNPIQPWSNYFNPATAFEEGTIVLQQDFRLLGEMLPVWVGEYASLIEQGEVSVDAIDWFLCHYSTHHLREEIALLMDKAGCMIPEEKWFNNLYSKGNTGSASLLIMLEELFNEKELQAGQKIFCVVPESGRSIISFMMLKVVKA